MNFEESQSLAASFGELGAQCVFGDPTRGGFEGVDAIRLPSIDPRGGAVLGWRAPAGLDVDAIQRGAKLARLAVEAAAKVKAIDADESRSDAWKLAEREKVAAWAAAEFERAHAEAQRAIDAFNEADARESVPPPLAPSDAVGALLDRELRDVVRAMDPAAQAALARDLLAGQHPRALAALLRSPLPWAGVLGEALPTAWMDAQARANPRDAALRAQAKAATQWLGEIAEQVRHVLPRAAATAPIVRRVA